MASMPKPVTPYIHRIGTSSAHNHIANGTARLKVGSSEENELEKREAVLEEV